MLGAERYSILREIASGSTATVYLAEDNVLRRQVALKKLHPHLHNHAETVRRFEKEAVAIAALSHENIIKVFDFGNQGRELYLAMEFVDGASLEAMMKDKGCLPNLSALSLFHQLLQGLAAAHAHGIYHRDIKPSNVLVDNRGRVRIADFGIAFLSQEVSITKTGSYLGTPGYSAPEQAEGRLTTGKTDIFATGILFYRCLTGRLPFEGESPHAVLMAIMEKVPTKAQSLNRRLLPGLQDLVESMLEKGPENRPGAADCIAKLEAIARKSGFPFESTRLARFLKDGEPYREEENREIAGHFVACARLARKERDARRAMKLFSLAEIFGVEEATIKSEVAGIASALRWKRNLILFGAIALAVGLAGVVWSWRSPTRQGEAAATQKLSTPATVRPTAFVAQGVHMAGNPGIVPSAATVSPSLPSSVRTVSKAAASPHAHKPGKSASIPSNPFATASYAAAKSKTLSVPPVARDSSAHVPDALPSHVGYLIVKTSPPFAKLFVDGMDAGTTPTRKPLEIRPGSHELILEREGCKPLHAEFRVTPSETTSVRLTLDRTEPEAQ